MSSKAKNRAYTPETAKVEILRLSKQIEGMTKKGEPAKGTFNATLLDTCRRKKSRLEAMLTREDRPETFTTAWSPMAPTFRHTDGFPPSFHFNLRTDAPSAEEVAGMELPAFLVRNKNNKAPFMDGYNETSQEDQEG